MDYLGLFTEFIFLGIGIYVYLFAIGKIKFNSPQAIKFRDENATLLRFLALAVIAIMTVNIIFHFKQI
ncbi:MAG: hypothetical protein RJA52_678 [Bacteroidota bacterium]|jgi:hypothetical protein